MRSPYRVDLDSFREGFPDGIQVPPLLEAFARWLEDIPYGGVGYFELLGEPLDVTYVSDEDEAEAVTERLRRQLGIFLHLGEGSRLALWYYGAAPPAVVLIGSEGDLKNIAPSLEAFLVALSEGRTGVGLGLDSGCEESKRPDLRAWLAQQRMQAPALAEPPPDFHVWFEASAGWVSDVDGTPRLDPDATVKGDDLVANLGNAADDPIVREMMADLGLAEHADCRPYWCAVKFGVGALFMPARLYQNNERFSVLAPETDILSDIQFSARGYCGGPPFSGELPFGLSYADTRDVVHRRFGSPSHIFPTGTECFVIGDLYMNIYFDHEGGVLREVMCGLVGVNSIVGPR